MERLWPGCNPSPFIFSPHPEVHLDYLAVSVVRAAVGGGGPVVRQSKPVRDLVSETEVAQRTGLPNRPQRL